MNRQLLTIMMAGIDLWAVLFVLHYRTTQPWDVSVVITNPDQPPRATLADPVPIWMTRDELGVWPDMRHSLTIEAVQALLAKRAADCQRVEVRLLCDPSLSLRQWGRVAFALSRHAEEIRIAPLPEDR